VRGGGGGGGGSVYPIALEEILKEVQQSNGCMRRLL